MIKCWRICQRRYADTIFDGIGGLLANGRWLPKGHRVVYTAANIALGMMEYQVNNPAFRADDVMMAELTIPDHVEIYVPGPAELPVGWNNPKSQGECWEFGVGWYKRNQYVAMKVPSVVVPLEYNYIVNVEHADFGKLLRGSPISVEFDPRL